MCNSYNEVESGLPKSNESFKRKKESHCWRGDTNIVKVAPTTSFPTQQTLPPRLLRPPFSLLFHFPLPLHLPLILILSLPNPLNQSFFLFSLLVTISQWLLLFSIELLSPTPTPIPISLPFPSPLLSLIPFPSVLPPSPHFPPSVEP